MLSRSETWNRPLFLLGMLFAVTPFASPALALVVGLAMGLTLTHPWPRQARKATHWLLQASVVGLGFGMNLHEVLQAGRSGFFYTVCSISFAMLLGTLLGKLLRVDGTASLLISAGTAICGGSAIAALGPIAGANDEQMAVSMGTIFVLNSVALLIFPPIGLALHLSQTQFGLWAALAIHDTSSVVGAGARYGAIALLVATTVKLARALWIVPMSLGTAAVKKSEARIRWPWFIAFFCLAALLNTLLPAAKTLFHGLERLGETGLTLTLFLIGSSLSRATLRRVGARPMFQGILLWLVVGSTALWLIHAGWIHL